MSRICIGSIGRNGRKNEAAAMLNMLPKLELVPINRYFITLPKALRPSMMPVCSDRQAVFQKNDLGGVLGDVDGRGDRDADVGRVQRGSVVDAVAEKADDVTSTLERQDDAVLLRGETRAKTVVCSATWPSAVSLMRSSSIAQHDVAPRRGRLANRRAAQPARCRR